MFGRISPTSAKEVKKELEGKVNYILDGGKSKFGIESTVIAFENNKPVILRPGFITKDKIEKVLRRNVEYILNKKFRDVLSPGLLKMHYSPVTPLYLCDDNFNIKSLNNLNAGFLDLNKFSNLNELASGLFSEIRKLDEKHFDFIISKKTIDEGIGYAINDRLEKASHGKIRFTNNKPIITKK